MNGHETPRRITPWRETWRQLIRAAAPHQVALRRSLLELLAAATLQGMALACLLPIFRALMPAAGNGTPGFGTALPWLVLFTVLGVAVQVVRWRAQGFDYTGKMAEVTHTLRNRLGKQLRRMPLLKLQEKRTGEMSAALLGNVDDQLNYTLTIVNMAAQAVVTPLVASLMVLTWDWRLGLGMLLVFPAILPLYRWRRPVFGRGVRMLAQAQERTQGDTLEYTQGLAVLRAARSAGSRAQRLQESFWTLERLQRMGQLKGARPNVIVTSVVEVGLLLVMAAGVTWVTQGSLDVAVLAAVTVMLSRFAEPLSTFISMTAIFEMIEAALERIEALLAIPALPLLQPVQQPTHFDISFEQVDFRYADDAPWVLHGFDARLPAHGMMALEGPSGRG